MHRIAMGIFTALCACAIAPVAMASAPTPTAPEISASTTAAASSSAVNFNAYRPQATATRITPGEAPEIDGDLSEPVWARAQVIEDFFQVEPIAGAKPSQRTTAYILYDEKTLYVGVYAYDTNPAGIRRSQMQRDPQMQDDDAVRILLDPFGSFRDTYFFAVNPNGARLDALTENNGAFRSQWNAIWRAEARVVEDGWIAEFAIPFQSISFDASLEEWNLQIIRTVRRENEEIRWSNIDQNRGRIDMTNPGRLAGIRNIESGAGLEVQAFVTGAGAYDWESGDTNTEIRPSGNAFYKITPSLTGSLTVNTDFSDTALDSRQVNTGRFSLFFPETRDFFLQDATVFEFGGRVFNNGQVNGLPFFSRNIGIVDDVPVDLLAGAKLSGKLGPANVGIISTRTGADDTNNIDGQFLSAARISVPVLTESKAGLIFTNGDPNGATNSTVVGTDFQYRKTNVFGGGTLSADAVYVHTFTDGLAGHMLASEAAFRSQKWNGTLRLRDIGDNYAPQLGFANRVGIRRYNANTYRVFRPENSFIRRAEIGMFSNLITDRNNVRLDQDSGFFSNVANNAGDDARFEYERAFVEIDEPFDIAGAVPVAMGQYRWNQYELRVRATSARMIGAKAEVRWGGIYDGDYLSVEGEINLRPNRRLEFAAEYEYTDISLPSGQIGIHVVSIDSTIAFTPDMTIKTEVQYDNISEALTFFSRFSWEPTPEREVFLSFGHTAIIERETFPNEFVSQGSSLALRLGHTFRR